MKLYQLLVFLVLLISISCNNNSKTQQETAQAPTNEKAFVVKEVIQTTSYTYLKVEENSEERWVAISKTDAKSGDKYYYDEALKMSNFHSKELNRDFETIYFINKASTIPLSVQKKIGAMPHHHSGKAKVQKGSSISLEKSNDELTVGQIFENPKKFENKEIEIRGIVVKVNKQVMGKNWIHIQDGTAHNESFDLTITSMDLPVKGDEVTLKGTIILNKDFGAGYFYDVIMEKAKLVSTVQL